MISVVRYTDTTGTLASTVTAAVVIIGLVGVAAVARSKMPDPTSSNAVSNREDAIITIDALSGKLGVKLAFFSSNPMSMGAIIKEVTGDCSFSSDVDTGDLVLAVNGKDAKSQGNFACPEDGRRELCIVKSRKLAIIDGGVLSPPSNNESYTDESVKLLLRVLEPAAISVAFQKAGYGEKNKDLYSQ